MSRRHSQLFLVFLAFVITMACVFLMTSPQVIGAMAGAFLTVVGAYTALDLRAVVKSTGSLPSGTYAKADKWTYFSGILFLVLLFGACMIKQKFHEINLDLAYGFLGPGIVAIIGFIVAGMKINKAATMQGPAPEEKGSAG